MDMFADDGHPKVKNNSQDSTKPNNSLNLHYLTSLVALTVDKVLW